MDRVGNPLGTVDREILGLDLPEAAERLLRDARRAWSDPEPASLLLDEAGRIAPDHPAILIARYRFFFYHGRLEEALDVLDLCLSRGLRELGVRNWRELRPDQARFGDWDAVVPRFLLFSLKALAYLRLRLGDREAAAEALAKVHELDPTDKVGAGVLDGVMAREGRDDDDD
jgi:tetratricopeptide (TPR) repeat protein